MTVFSSGLDLARHPVPLCRVKTDFPGVEFRMRIGYTLGMSDWYTVRIGIEMLVYVLGCARACLGHNYVHTASGSFDSARRRRRLRSFALSYTPASSLPLSVK